MFANLQNKKMNTNKAINKIKRNALIIEGILIVLLILFSGFNCKKEIDSQKLVKQGNKYYEQGNTKPFSGRVIQKNAKGEIISSTSYTDGIMDGLLKKWYSKSRLMSQVLYKKGKLSGEGIYYYKNAQKRAVFHYSNGRPNGINQFWFKNGKLKEESFYKDGVYEGSVKKWDRNGKLLSHSIYKKGKKIK